MPDRWTEQEYHDLIMNFKTSKMDQIKLEEIAGYLPYGLKCKCEGLIYEVEGMRKKYIIFNNFGDTLSCYYENVKPLLHPLSDLTREIKANKQEFVPITELGYMNTPQSTLWLIREVKTGSISFKKMLMLLKWHFDIYNLIDRGLAIDLIKSKL
jgi:hypothetical protein